ncbi:TetR/AcrR family transcriptional regulator (plasmid) [Pseudovibrio brasiliensis]|uniref:TetR/AcrR family transcriptional regulator n=1 Tax=Pseudovibrio brasiliensis TaxID=1898042 RepID=A0ABX8ATS1_9HYPH|nr:TetR/AcrR family transcriptional regulator [Pseudovibrio brasiliensis]
MWQDVRCGWEWDAAVGRKSLKVENTNRILDAFERCIEAYGLRGATLEVVAKQAEMDRRMVLHYVGKREALVAALVERIVARFEENALDFLRDQESEDLQSVLLEYLFSSEFNTHPSTRLVAALLPEALHDDQIRPAVKSIYDAFHQSVAGFLREIAPQADESRLEHTAFQIMSLSFGGGWMTNIGFQPTLTEANKALAKTLLTDLAAS